LDIFASVFTTLQGCIDTIWQCEGCLGILHECQMKQDTKKILTAYFQLDNRKRPPRRSRITWLKTI